jgi:hypothetical protein
MKMEQFCHVVSDGAEKCGQVQQLSRSFLRVHVFPLRQITWLHAIQPVCVPHFFATPFLLVFSFLTCHAHVCDLFRCNVRRRTIYPHAVPGVAEIALPSMGVVTLLYQCTPPHCSLNDHGIIFSVDSCSCLGGLMPSLSITPIDSKLSGHAPCIYLFPQNTMKIFTTSAACLALMMAPLSLIKAATSMEDLEKMESWSYIHVSSFSHS